MLNKADFGVLDDAAEGDQLVVRFKPEGSEALNHIEMMVRLGMLVLDLPQMEFLDAVHTSKDWKGDSNRTQTFTVGLLMKRSYFEARFFDVLESLRVTRAH